MNTRASHLQGWIMYAIAAFFYFYDFILRLIPSIMMENIIERLQITTNQFGILELSFYIVYTPMQLLCGPLLDEYGAKRVLPGVITLCILGSILSAITKNYYWYLMARTLIGFGSAFAFVCVLKIASEWLPKKNYPFLAGLTTTFGMLGGIFSESVAPAFNQFDQTYFYSGIVVIGAILLILSMIFIEDKESHDDSEFDLKLIIKDIKLVLTKSQIWVAGLIGLAMFSPIQLFVTWAIKFFQQDLGTTEILAGNITSMLFWGACTIAPISGWIAGEITHKKRLLFIGNSVALLGMVGILYSAHTDVLSAMILMFIVGAGIATQPLVFVYATRQVSLHLTATAVAATNFIVNLSSLLQPYIGSQLIEISKQVYSLESWRYALSIIPALLAVNLIAIMCLKEIQYDEND